MLDVCTRTWDLLSPCMAKQDFTSLLVQQGLPDSILPMMTEPCWNLFLPSLSPCIGIFGKLIYAHKGSKFSFFYGNWRLITVCITALQSTQICAGGVKSTYVHPVNVGCMWTLSPPVPLIFDMVPSPHICPLNFPQCVVRCLPTTSTLFW